VGTRAAQRLTERDGQRDVQVVAIATEERVRLDVHGEDDVSRRAACRAWRALTAQPYLVAFGDAGRDARSNRHGSVGAWHPERERLLGAAERVREGDGQRALEIGAARGAPRAPAGAAPAEQVLEVEWHAPADRAEDILERARPAPAPADGLLIRAHLARGVRIEALADPGLAELIVERALLGIGEDVVREADVLEAFFRALVAGVSVRVQVLRERAIGLLQRVRRRVARHAEDSVEVALRHDPET
jgi:hypothetical protein